MTQKRKEKRKEKGKQSKRRKNKDKIAHLDKTTQSVLKRMIADDDNSSGNVKQKELLIDLETQFKQRQDRFWNALKERYHVILKERYHVIPA